MAITPQQSITSDYPGTRSTHRPQFHLTPTVAARKCAPFRNPRKMSRQHREIIIALYGAIAIVPPRCVESIDFAGTPDGESHMISNVARFGHNVLLTGFALLTVALVLQFI